MTDQGMPTERARDVFLLLLDAYREAQASHLRNLYGPLTPVFDLIDAECVGWRTRFDVAVARAAAQQREVRP